MKIFALLFAAIPAALILRAVLAQDNRSVWSELRAWHGVVYSLLAVATVFVSLFHFSAINNHAWRPHEESLWFALRGDADSDGISDSQDGDIDGDGTPNAEDRLNDSYHPLETQPLLRWIYRTVGFLVGAQPESQGADPNANKSSWDELKYAFMGTALFLGMWGAVLAGLAGQLLTRRAWVGFGVAALLVLHPTLAYWRVNAFHVACSHVAFCATLLAAVLAARRPSRGNLTAWFVLGALCLYLRSEQAGAVAATAAIPLLCSESGGLSILKRWKDWLPGLGLAAVLLAPPTIRNMRLAAERQDYRTGWRFARIHLGIPEVWEPMVWPGLALLILLGTICALLPASKLPNEIRRPARALVVIAALGVLPTLFFTSFGSRHLLNSGTAAILLGMVGLAGLSASPLFSRSRVLAALVTALVGIGSLAPVALASWTKLEAWDQRYYVREASVPSLPDTAKPDEVEPEFDRVDCGTYAAAWQLCNPSQWPECHPPKDLRDPVLVQARWEKHDGCLVWAIDETDNEVAGTRHEWWMVVRHLYRWEPLGIIEFEEGGKNKRVDVYRMAEPP